MLNFVPEINFAAPDKGGGVGVKTEVAAAVDWTVQAAWEIHELTPQQQVFSAWLQENSEYVEIHNIADNVKVLKNWVEFTNVEETIFLPFWQIHNQAFADVDNRPDVLNLTLENFWRILNILGGNFQGRKYHIAWTREIASFLHKVLGWDYNTFTWSSSHDHDYHNFAWGLMLYENEVWFFREYKAYRNSAISSQN